jgi:hypothetical protein
MWSTAVVVVAVSAAVSAQSGKDMSEPKMGDKMNTTYTGCIEAVNDGSSFLLTHVADDDKAMMHHDAMMKSGTEMAKKDDPRPSGEMHDHMMPAAVLLTGRSDLKKHVGQKVTVSGAVSHVTSEMMPDDRDMLTVASLKVVAKSCS